MNDRNTWTLIASGAIAFVLTAMLVILGVSHFLSKETNQRNDAVTELRKEVAETEQTQIKESEVRAIADRLFKAREPTNAEYKKKVNNAIQRLTVRERQRFLNSLLRVATKRQKRFLQGIVPTPLPPPAPQRRNAVPRSVKPPPRATPPIVGISPVTPPPVSRNPFEDDEDDDNGDNDDEDDESRSGE